MDSTLELVIGLGCGFPLPILGLLFYKFPPKTINHIYGYSTRRSMKNQDTWDSANAYSSNWMMRFGVFTVLISGAVYVVLPQLNALISVLAMIALVIIILPITEEHLKRHYADDGAPKSVVNNFGIFPTGLANGE